MLGTSFKLTEGEGGVKIDFAGICLCFGIGMKGKSGCVICVLKTTRDTVSIDSEKRKWNLYTNVHFLKAFVTYYFLAV